MTTPPQPVHEKFPGTGFVVLCFDGPNGDAARAAATPDHLKYIESVLHEVNVAGPMHDPSGIRTIGSLYMLATSSEAAARALIENDPYFKAGAFAEVRYQRFLPAAGRYIGGKIW
ncbi:MAG TPA: YciI family protein [Steroidobacteraceae bacterium]|nr:YciI family protein [Steroidobacteraceae bacterium]HRX89205.1 YciI family protein [Steroidobacteraceae bacterium]